MICIDYSFRHKYLRKIYSSCSFLGNHPDTSSSTGVNRLGTKGGTQGKLFSFLRISIISHIIILKSNFFYAEYGVFRKVNNVGKLYIIEFIMCNNYIIFFLGMDLLSIANDSGDQEIESKS